MKKKIIYIGVLVAFILIASLLYCIINRDNSDQVIEDFTTYEYQIEQIIVNHDLHINNSEIIFNSDEITYKYYVNINQNTILEISFEYSKGKEIIYIDYYSTITEFNDRRNQSDMNLIIEIYNSISRKQFKTDEYNSFLYDEKYIFRLESDNEYTELREISLDFFEKWRGLYYIYPKYSDNYDLPREYKERVFLTGLINWEVKIDSVFFMRWY